MKFKLNVDTGLKADCCSEILIILKGFDYYFKNKIKTNLYSLPPKTNKMPISRCYILGNSLLPYIRNPYYEKQGGEPSSCKVLSKH